MHVVLLNKSIPSVPLLYQYCNTLCASQKPRLLGKHYNNIHCGQWWHTLNEQLSFDW
jgi:hypothetical protein